MDPAKRAFYRFHASLMEPWDGPASIAFTDGTVIGAVLDRNGLRPSRYWVTDDDLVIMASEVGVLDVDPAKVVQKGRLQPGRMFLVDTAAGPHRRRRRDQGRRWPPSTRTRTGWTTASSSSTTCPTASTSPTATSRVLRRQQVFGYTHEELKIILAPMAKTGARADRLDGHRHADRRAVRPAAPAVRLLPAAVRPGHQPAARRHPRGAGHRPRLHHRPGGQPARARRRRRAARSACRSRSSTTTSWPSSSTINADGDLPGFAGRHRQRPVPRGRRRAGAEACARRHPPPGQRGHRRRAPASSCSPTATPTRCWRPIPSLLLTSAVHHHLIREKTRTKVGLVVECGDAREVHHMALLIGYGAGAINPYLAFESIEDMIAEGLHGLGGLDPVKAVRNYIKAAGKGVLKVMSKMGISTVASYTGAQIFEAIGLGHELVDEYFTGTVSRLGGIGLDELAAEVAARHAIAHPDRPGRAGPPPASSSAASTSGGARARSTCSTRRPCSSCSTPPGPSATTSSSSTRRWSTTSRRSWPRCAGLFEFAGRRARAGADRRGRAGQRDREALLHRRHELRLDLGRGPRDAGHRHEPHRRQVQHRRGRRGPRALRAADPTATRSARPSSRWHRAASA